jgi:hypothetical protein
MFDLDDVPRVLWVPSLETSCGEEARGRLSSAGNGDVDSEGSIEQLRLVSSDIYMYQAPQSRKSRV